MRPYCLSGQFTRKTAAILTVALILCVSPSSVGAHSGPPPVPETVWSTWNLDPLIMTTLMIGVWAYVRGVRALWSRTGRGRGIRYWQVAAGSGGFVAIGIAVISPLDPLSSALFSAHMLQHMLLIAVAPPLLILGDAGVASLWSLPARWRRKAPALWHAAGPLQPLWNNVARPVPVVLIHSLALWAWHVPMFYDAAVRNTLIHAFEHLTMFGTAFLFWWIVIQRGRQTGLSYGFGILMIFGIVIQKTALGALISFSPEAWYAEHSTTTAAWGLTPVEDQQLAGAVMMGPWGAVYLIAGVTLFAWWIRAIERSVDRDERLAIGYVPANEKQDGQVKETA